MNAFVPPPLPPSTAPDPQVSEKHSDLSDGGQCVGRCHTADVGGTHALLQNQTLVSLPVSI